MSRKIFGGFILSALLLSIALTFSVARPAFGFNPDPPTVWLARKVGSAHETIAFDVESKRARFILPNGLRSADGKAYWAAFQAGGMTAFHSFDVAEGSIRASLGLEGSFELGAISATGKWLALKRVASESEIAAWTKANAWKTTIAIVDAEQIETTRTVTLDGNFDVDALSAGGKGLFLIEHLPALKPDHYQVRLYDVALGQLQEGALVDKRNVNEVMAGYARDAVASPNGEWLFTLYIGTHHSHAFIHALNLREGYAWCIDLPSGDGNRATLEHYALALAPDGTTIYASNAALGVLTSTNVANIGEPRVVNFAPFADKANSSLRSALVSPHGKRVFFSDAGTLWQYDVALNRAQEMKRATMPILGLAVREQENSLHIAYADHSVSAVALDANAVSASVTNAENNSACRVTPAPRSSFVSPTQSQPLVQEFWHGTESLWTSLRHDGTWNALPYYDGAYLQKVFWWSKGYVGSAEPEPALRVTGKRLDANAPLFAAAYATNAYHPDFGWAILTGVEIPTVGCWEITGEYKGEKLSFVVQVLP